MTNFTLHTGRKIPAIAFGTGTSYFNRSNDVIEGIVKAFDAGFRYIDTAIAYGTEEGVGKAVKKLIEVKCNGNFGTKLANDGFIRLVVDQC